MRCLYCYYIIALPDIINGEPGKPGMIRARRAVPMEPQSVVVEFYCPRCGSQYKVTTELLPGKVAPVDAVELSDREKERNRVWKS